ncbi:MAG: hypothetical protein K6D97_05980 [Clostridia bacterium]|nr:hypothetical protein [Clostridia bacterium]
MIIIVILIILIIVTGFRSGEKFFILQNTNLDSGNNNLESSIKRWEFNVKVISNGKEVEILEKDTN